MDMGHRYLWKQADIGRKEIKHSLENIFSLIEHGRRKCAVDGK
jgi:hypothetical protein